MKIFKEDQKAVKKIFQLGKTIILKKENHENEFKFHGSTETPQAGAYLAGLLTECGQNQTYIAYGKHIH